MPSVLCNKIKLLTLLLVVSCTANAQTRRIDSLKMELPAQAGMDKLPTLLALCREGHSLPPDSLIRYARAARELVGNDAIKAALSEYYIAFGLLTKGLQDSSLRIVERQLRTLRYEGSTSEVFVNFSLLKARALNNSSKSKESLDILYPLLNDAEKREDTLTQIGAINSMVGAYVIIGQSKKALEWGYRSVSRFPQRLSLPLALQAGITLGNISLCYLHVYEKDSIPSYLDSAEKYTTLAIDLDRQYQFIGAMAYNLGLKGTVLGYAHKPAEGEAILKESLDAYQKIGNLYYIINAMSVLGNFYRSTNQPEKGIAICKEGLALSGNLRPNYYLYDNLSENYRIAGRYKEYGATMAQLMNLKDSMYNVNTAEALSDLQTKYEVQKKENIIFRQKIDLNKKNNLLYGSLALVVLLVVVGYILLAIRKKNQAIAMERLQVEEKKKTLQAVLQAEENERKRIAADLHDGVAQKMVVAKLNLQALESFSPAFNAEQQKVFSNITALVEESVSDVRDLSHSMMPQAFFRSGLTEAVRNLLNKIGPAQLLIKFSAEGQLENVDSGTQIMVYRIMQECIQNVLKHAKATRLDISIIAESGEIDVTIEDDGIGFDPGMENEGAGLQSIRSRVAFLNGQVDISSRPGAGTITAIYIPNQPLNPSL